MLDVRAHTSIAELLLDMLTNLRIGSTAHAHETVESLYIQKRHDEFPNV